MVEQVLPDVVDPVCGMTISTDDAVGHKSLTRLKLLDRSDGPAAPYPIDRSRIEAAIRQCLLDLLHRFTCH